MSTSSDIKHTDDASINSPEEQTGEISNEERRSIWRDAFFKLLENYKNDMRKYEELAEVVSGLCKQLVDAEGILAQVSKRTKTYESFEKKARKLAMKFLDKDSSVKTKEEALNKLDQAIVDRAGIRILVYFPDAVLKVAELVENSSEFIVEVAKLGFAESRTVRDRSNLQPKDYPHGDWISFPKGGISQHWRHSGYRAGHLRVKMDDTSPNSLGGSEMWVEIQITTIVMHAWAQVEHDIVYKDSSELPPDESMNRTLDAINGLSITSEILLEELARNMQRANEKAREKSTKQFEDANEFIEWFKETYPETGLMGQKAQDWEETPKWVGVLLSMGKLSASKFCRAGCKSIIEHQGLLQMSPRGSSEKLDISIHLLKKMGEESDVHQRRLPHYRKDLSLPILQVAVAFSFMVLLKETKAIEMIKKKYGPRSIDIIQKINITTVLGGFILSKDVEEFGNFTDRFLKDNWCETHDLAVALARLGFVIETPGYALGDRAGSRILTDWFRT
ncbi:hypothetical protein F4805DRAFT_461749 [Annulohypoxylon moriforme]|nr:hypothetical protein F4805DRAFT_461749 [Annulohypoxylon moriforme]